MSRQVSEGFGGCLIAEASQTGAIVVGEEDLGIGVAFGVVEKAAVVGGTVLRHAAEVLAEAAVEAFDHAVGLRMEGLGEAVLDGVMGAGPVERVPSRRLAFGLSLHVDGEAVGEFGAPGLRRGRLLSVRMVWTVSGKPARKRSRNPAAVSARRSGKIPR